MRKRTVWAKLLGVERMVIERVEFDEVPAVAVSEGQRIVGLVTIAGLKASRRTAGRRRSSATS